MPYPIPETLCTRSSNSSDPQTKLHAKSFHHKPPMNSLQGNLQQIHLLVVEAVMVAAVGVDLVADMVEAEEAVEAVREEEEVEKWWR